MSERRGRRGAAELSVVGAAAARVPGVRLEPPKTLTPAQRELWVVTVNSRPPEWFGPEHSPLLEQYCRHKSQADALAKRLEDWETREIETAKDLKQYQTLRKMHEMESRMVISFATRMRMTQQAVYGARKAATGVRAAQGIKPWERKA